MTTWVDVTATLLARWPAQRWDREQAAAYIRELQSDGLAPGDAMTGLRAASSAFVPSVGEVTAAARRVNNADLPTLDEVTLLIEQFNYGRDPDRVLTDVHPVAAAFVARNAGRWHGAPLVGEDGKWNRKEITVLWDEYRENAKRREVALIAAGRGNEFDPLTAITRAPNEPALPATTMKETA